MHVNCIRSMYAPSVCVHSLHIFDERLKTFCLEIFFISYYLNPPYSSIVPGKELIVYYGFLFLIKNPLASVDKKYKFE